MVVGVDEIDTAIRFASLFTGEIMKNLLFAFALLAGPGSTYAAACVGGTLSDYIALGSGGCTIAGNKLTDFSATSVLTGASAINAGNVDVTAVNGASRFGLDFKLAAGAPNSTGPLGLFNLLLGYSVTGLGLTGASIGLGANSVSGNAAITATEDICVNGKFSNYPLSGAASCATSQSATLVTASTEFFAFEFDSAAFLPVGFLNVFVDLTLDGGSAGNASLSGPVSTRFDVAQRSDVPEPSSLALMLLAVGSLGYARRRRPAHTAPG